MLAVFVLLSELMLRAGLLLSGASFLFGIFAAGGVAVVWRGLVKYSMVSTNEQALFWFCNN